MIPAMSIYNNEQSEHNDQDSNCNSSISQIGDNDNDQASNHDPDTDHINDPGSEHNNHNDQDPNSDSDQSKHDDYSEHSDQPNVSLLPRDNKGISIDAEVELDSISIMDDAEDRENSNNDYNFTWWPIGYTSEYIKSDTPTNTKLGDMRSADNAIMAYIYGRDNDDNLFNQMDKRRNTVADMMDKLHIGWRYTPKQRAYIEWYYITRGLPIEANPSVDVQQEFDRYWLLSMNGLKYGPIKYMPINYTNIMDKIESHTLITAIQRENYYCSWYTQHRRGPLRSLYCYEWDMSNQACINMHKNGVKSMKFTEYIRWYTRRYMTSIDLLIQPTLSIMIAFEKYLQMSKHDSVDVYMPMRFKSLTIDDLSVLDDDNMVNIRVYKHQSRIPIWIITITLLLILVVYLLLSIPYMTNN